MSLRTPFPRTAASLARHMHKSPLAMPLRSKLTDPVFGARRSYAISNDPRELSRPIEGDEQDDVVFTFESGLRIIQMNRPKKLNSLNGSMARKLIGRLKEYQKSQLLSTILIHGAGRAFCAGGDVAALARWNQEGPKGRELSADYFALEYKLDHLIATYTQPYIAFLDGITMGGGVGLSVHAPFRIATENTVFAMPETTIGFFPDVGASFFLPRMDGGMGTYLALTSDQLKGADVFYHGIATHYIHSTSLPALQQRLGELEFKDYSSFVERLSIVNATIEEFVSGLPAPRPQITGELRKVVDAVFMGDSQSALDILKKLDEIQSGKYSVDIKEWAEKTIKTIRERSPTSVAVTLRQMQTSRSWNIAEAFQHEHNIATRFMSHPDFVEGVTARLVDRKKERPNWKPNSLEEVTKEEVDAFFGAPLKLALLNDSDEMKYKEYPYGPKGTDIQLGLPSEEAVVSFRRGSGGKLQSAEIVKHFVDKHRGKQGVKEKVEEVLERV